MVDGSHCLDRQCRSIAYNGRSCAFSSTERRGWQLFKFKLNFNKKKQAEGLIGIEVAADGVALAYVQWTPEGAPNLSRCLFREAPPQQQGECVCQMVQELGLEGLPANVVLPPSAYQLLLVDRPDVPDQELRDALRWKLKELTGDSPDNVVIDAFPLPQDAYRGRSRMAYLVVADKEKVAHAEALRASGARLSAIDVTEMAMRNIGLLLLGEEQRNLALLRLGSSGGLITIQHGPDVYMARRIERGGAYGGQGGLEALALEVQRSLDYFENQLGKGYINQLALLPAPGENPELLEHLKANLTVSVDRLNLAQWMPDAPMLSDHVQARCAIAIGAALRREDEA